MTRRSRFGKRLRRISHLYMLVVMSVAVIDIFFALPIDRFSYVVAMGIGLTALVISNLLNPVQETKPRPDEPVSMKTWTQWQRHAAQNRNRIPAPTDVTSNK